MRTKRSFYHRKPIVSFPLQSRFAPTVGTTRNHTFHSPRSDEERIERGVRDSARQNNLLRLLKFINKVPVEGQPYLMMQSLCIAIRHEAEEIIEYLLDDEILETIPLSAWKDYEDLKQTALFQAKDNFAMLMRLQAYFGENLMG